MVNLDYMRCLQDKRTNAVKTVDYLKKKWNTVEKREYWHL